jgi:acyl carrier protein
MDSIELQVRQFIVENFLFGEEEALCDGDSFLEKGIIDSTGVLELVVFLEEKYHIAIADDDLVPSNLDSIDSLVRFITEKLNVNGKETNR